MSSRKIALIGVLMILTVGIIFQLVAAKDAEPAGVEGITRGASTTFNGSLYPAANTTAEAGNITSIDLEVIGPTRFWQGFYGEVTGEIVLEDANGNTLYNWSSAEPQGQIYASTSNSISWLDVACMDSANDVTWTTTETKYDIADIDEDGIVDTFVNNDHPTFWIGNNEITGCNTTWTFVNSAVQTERFPMAILEEDAVADVDLYVTWMENRDNGNATDVTGFDGVTHDFQFMVPENGTSNNRVTTTYYFWAAIA